MVDRMGSRIVSVTDLPTPREVREEHPLVEKTAKEIDNSREAIGDILHGRDDRLLVVAGPCSIHDHESAITVAKEIKRLQLLNENLLLVMRVYLEKPRTTVGWKGLINDPELDGSNNLAAGLFLARRILKEIAEMGVPIATEQLDVHTPEYIGDLVSWSAIGARSTENQGHREMASGLPSAVGVKNGTSGGTQTAVNAIVSMQNPHTYIATSIDGKASVVESTGNDDAHLILRGGESGPNYSEADVNKTAEAMIAAGLEPNIVVDTSHKNSPNGYKGQLEASTEVARQISGGSNLVKGVMFESHIVEGAQKVTPGKTKREDILPEQSITDGCINMTDTELALTELNEAVGERNTVKNKYLDDLATGIGATRVRSY